MIAALGLGFAIRSNDSQGNRLAGIVVLIFDAALVLGATRSLVGSLTSELNRPTQGSWFDIHAAGIQAGASIIAVLLTLVLAVAKLCM
jgi:hypothetical protein